MSKPGGGGRLGLAGIAAAAVAIVCCAAGPLLVAWVGSVAVGALLGVGAGVAVVVVALTLLFLRRRSSSHPEASP